MENGCRIDDPTSIKQEFVKHFQSVLGSNMQMSATVDYNLDDFNYPKKKNLDGLVWSSKHLDILNSGITHEESRDLCSLLMTQRPPVPMGSHPCFSKRPGAL